MSEQIKITCIVNGKPTMSFWFPPFYEPTGEAWTELKAAREKRQLAYQVWKDAVARGDERDVQAKLYAAYQTAVREEAVAQAAYNEATKNSGTNHF